MSVTATSNTGMASMVPVYFEKLGLERLLANTVMYGLAKKQRIPMNSGKTVQFHRLYNLSNTVSAASLTEGTAPTPGLVSATNVSATLEQYGTSIQVSDLLEMTAVSDILKDTVEQLGEQAGQIIDRRIVACAYGTSSIPSGAGFPIVYDDGTIAALSTLTSTHTLDADSIRFAISELRRKNVKPMEDGSFIYVAEPAPLSYLESDSEWQAAYQYSTPENLRNGEIGKMAGAKFVMSNNLTNTVSGTGAANGTTAFFSILLGRGSLGVTEIDGQFKVYTVPNTQIDHANPLAQYSTAGWKCTFVPVILNASCGLIHTTSGNA